MVRAEYSGILRLTCSRHSQPYSQSGYDFHIATCLFFCFNCAVYSAVFSGLQLGIDIPSTSKCQQLKQTVYQLNRPLHQGGCWCLGDLNKHTCPEVTGITELFEAWLLSTKWKWYPHKSRGGFRHVQPNRGPHVKGAPQKDNFFIFCNMVTSQKNWNNCY